MNFFRHTGLATTALLMLAACGDDSGTGVAPSGASVEADGQAGGAAQRTPAASATAIGDAATPAAQAQPPAAAPVPGKPPVAPVAVRAEPPPAFAQCRSCHSVEPGKHGLGPSLTGIFGKPAASVAGFRYSPALESASIVWTRDKLDEWLAGPTRMVPGTRMVLPVRDEGQRKAIIDYLETLKQGA